MPFHFIRYCQAQPTFNLAPAEAELSFIPGGPTTQAPTHESIFSTDFRFRHKVQLLDIDEYHWLPL